MRNRILVALLSIIMLFTFISPSATAAQNTTKPKERSNDNDVIAGKYIVKFKDGVKGKQALSIKNKKTEKVFKHLSSQVTMKLSANEVEDLKNDANVAYIEEDGVITKTGDIVSDSMKQINVPAANELGFNGSGVKVAILDTGIDTSNTDLKVEGGASFVESEPTFNDLNGHGTFVAGILAALKNDQSLVGVAPNISLYALKVMNQRGEGSYSQVISAIDWAIDNQIDIISMSFGGSIDSTALHEAIDLASQNGILLVAAAGNNASDRVQYPAAYNGVISVGAVDENNQIAGFSNHGKIDLVAPGVNILGYGLNGILITGSGTSAGAPQVAGVAALLKQQTSTMPVQEWRDKLFNSATPLGNAENYGQGLVNALAAITGTGGSGDPTGNPNPSNENMNNLMNGLAGVAVVSDSVYQSTDSLPILPLTTYTPDSSVLLAINNVNSKPDEAPFSISSSGENISTLTGNVTIENTDLSLPGRNGMSFNLKRKYDSGESQLYKQDVEPIVFCVCKVGFDGRQYQERTKDYTNIEINPYYNYYVGRLEYNPSSGSMMNNTTDASNLHNYLISQSGKRSYVSNWAGPDSNGYYIRSVSEVATTPNLSFDAQYTYVNGNPIYWWRSKAREKTPMESLYPIGKGWSWDVSYVKFEQSKTYVNIAGSGTYEISGSTLKGYPWKDLSFNTDNSVTVNGVTSQYVLASVHGTKQYFSGDGRLIQISDPNNNYIHFYYGTDPTYGKVLSNIKDAIGNSIDIQYSDNQVKLTQGTQIVTYSKWKYTNWNPLPPYNGLVTEILSSVQDANGRTTYYNYESKNAQFELTGSTPTVSNPYYILNQIMYPTGATTSYRYESTPITRYIAANAVNQVYRISSRVDRSGSQDYLSKTFTYTNPLGQNTDFSSSYQSIDHFYVNVNDGLKTVTYDNKKQYIDDQTPAVYYNTNITETAGSLKHQTSFVYDEVKKRPIPTTTSYTASNGSGTSVPVTSNKTVDDYGNVQSETNPTGIVTTFEYGTPYQLLTKITQPTDQNQTLVVDYSRDSTTGNLQQETFSKKGANGVLTTLAQKNYSNFTTFGQPKTIQVKDDNRMLSSSIAYGDLYSSGFPTSQSVTVKDVDGNPTTINTSYEYNKSTGQVTKSIDGKGYATQYEYDKIGRIKKITSPDLSAKSWQYFDSDNYVISTDETGLMIQTNWNSLGWKTSTRIVGSGLLTYDYDSYGRMKWSQDVYYNRTNYGYDAWNRLTQTIYPDNFTASVAYDDINFTQTATDAENNQTKETYDLLGRMTKKEWLKASGNIILASNTYDYAGNVLTSTDGKNYTTTYEYDVLNRLTSVTDPLVNTTLYSYSLANKLTQVEYADGNKDQKQYDELGRLIAKTDSSGQTEKYYYDANSNMSKYIDLKSQSQTYEYNNRNFLTSHITGNETVTYTYDTAGRRLTMQDATGTTSNAYDPITKLLKVVTYPDLKKIQYAYNVQGNRIQMMDPFNISTAYGYDVRNRLTGVGNDIYHWDASYTYKNNDLLATVQQGNGMSSTYGYDGFNMTSLSQKKTGGTLVNSYSYGYDNNFNQNSKTENGSSNSFEYDKLNRISISSQFNEQYTYDARGNRQTLQTNAATNINGASYTYDDRNRLTQVSSDDGKNVSYRYNGDGLLYERTENGVTTRYYYDGSNMIAEGTVANGTVTLKARYVRGNGLVAQIDAGGTKRYYISNGHGDVVGLADTSGNLVNTYTYDMWGNPLTTQETVAQPFRYSGEFWDNTTGLQNLRARWYDPSMGRFINKDTYEGQINNPLSLNLYTYVANNPLTHTDPTGHIMSGTNVGINIDNARNYGSGSELYWKVRSNLGSQAKSFIPGAYKNDNNNFKFWFGVATMTSDYSELNNEQDAAWAKGLLVSIFDADYNNSLADFDNAVAFATGGLDIPLKARPVANAGKVETFLPDAAYGNQLPDYVSPGTKSLMKYDETGQLKQTKYYDDYGRQTGWVDWTDHGYSDSHTTPHYHGIEWSAQYPIGGFKTDHRWLLLPVLE